MSDHCHRGRRAGRTRSFIFDMGEVDHRKQWHHTRNNFHTDTQSPRATGIARERDRDEPQRTTTEGVAKTPEQRWRGTPPRQSSRPKGTSPREERSAHKPCLFCGTVQDRTTPREHRDKDRQRQTDTARSHKRNQRTTNPKHRSITTARTRW